MVWEVEEVWEDGPLDLRVVGGGESKRAPWSGVGGASVGRVRVRGGVFIVIEDVCLLVM